jgi:hypothetical protein
MEFLTTTKVPHGMKIIFDNLSYQRVRDDTTYHYKMVGDHEDILQSLENLIKNRSSEILDEVGLSGELTHDHLVSQVLNPMRSILGTTDIEQSLRLINRILILYNEN